MGVQACGWLLITRSLSSFSAVAVSVMLLLQAALAAVSGVAFLDQTLIAIQVSGIAIVLLGLMFARPRADRARASLAMQFTFACSVVTCTQIDDRRN